MMTVSEFLGRCWYRTNLIIIKWQVFDQEYSIEQIKEQAIYIGTPHELNSDIHKNIHNMSLDSYGIIDGYLIILVH